MAKYIAQCKHRVGKYDNVCPVCKDKIQRIWNIDALGIDVADKLAEEWNKNINPKDFYEKEILPYNREECIFYLCSIWDDENPNADENTRNDAFKDIISGVYRAEYEKSNKDYKYYGMIQAIHSKDKDYIVV